MSKSYSTWREKMWRIIFEADTPAGKAFDVVLIFAIISSVLAVILESVIEYRVRYGTTFKIAEYFFTIFFTLEYICRIISSRKPKEYIFSFFGIIDLLAILPIYLGFFFVETQSLLVVRSFRLIRVFRVFKLTPYLKQAQVLSGALQASYQKIIVFLVAVLATVITMGTVMYLIEGPSNGFTSIPTSIYWSIVTMTTVGYGDIAPKTVLGQMLASLLMIIGYGMLAVPTGIVSVEMARADRNSLPNCHHTKHDPDAQFCKICGQKIHKS